MSLFIANAHANAGAAPQGGGIEMLIMLGLFAVIFYFMIYRPQAKRTKEHKNLINSLQKGDEILTSGGLVGKVTKVNEEKNFIAIALTDSVEIIVQKGAISAVLPKGTMKDL